MPLQDNEPPILEASVPMTLLRISESMEGRFIITLSPSFILKESKSIMVLSWASIFMVVLSLDIDTSASPSTTLGFWGSG